MTLREFIEKVNSHEQFRIYQPNRDCLIYESYFKVHSPYYFDDKHEVFDYNKDYYENNYYCRDVYLMKELDEETKIFLDKFGDYVVFRMECSGFRPRNMSKNYEGHIESECVEDPSMPERDYLDCFNLFIIPASVLDEDE